MLGAIELVDGATYSFDKFYRLSFLRLAEAAGNHIVFVRIGDPGLSDPRYKAMRTREMAKDDRRLRRQWERKFSTPEAEEHQRISESRKGMKDYALTDDDLPCFVFVTPRCRRVGLLRVDHHWHESESSWRVFVRCFCTWLEREDVKKLASADLPDAELSSRLSRSLGKLRQAIEGQLGSPETDVREAPDGQLLPGVYCRVITEKRTKQLSRAEYGQLVLRKAEFDMFIDGMTRRVSCRDARGKSRCSQLTPRELEMLLQYVKCRRAMRPCDTIAGKRCSLLETANHLFVVARRKVDPVSKPIEARFFQVIKHPAGAKQRHYQFVPPDHLTYRVIHLP